METESLGDVISNGGSADGGDVNNVDAGQEVGTSVLPFEERIVQLVNEKRASGATCGVTSMPPVAPLVPNADLTLIARAHSTDMATRSFFDHVNPDGKSPFDRMDEAGYDRPKPWGENIAAGQTTPERAMQSWMSSPGHCNNIMNGRFSQIGVGYHLLSTSQLKHYWTQAFSN